MGTPARVCVAVALCAGTLGLNRGSADGQTGDAFEFHDAHFHLTNYAQEGISAQAKALLRRHPETTIIWAHLGLGRIVHPVQPSASAPATERNPNHGVIVEGILSDPAFRHVHFDISWDEVAKYMLTDTAVLRRSADVINRYPDRILSGSDLGAPRDSAQYYSVYEAYGLLWRLLTPAAREQVLEGNYVRLFDRARERVRAWERANVR